MRNVLLLLVLIIFDYFMLLINPAISACCTHGSETGTSKSAIGLTWKNPHPALSGLSCTKHTVVSVYTLKIACELFDQKEA